MPSNKGQKSTNPYDSGLYNPLDELVSQTNVTSDEVSDSRPNKKSRNNNVSFTPEDFDSFIVSRGVPTLWQQAFICPCIDPVSKHPDPLCPICHGTYRGYLPAIKDTYVAIQSQDRGTTRTKEFGNLDLGTAKGTFRGGTDINVMDRITIPDLTTRQNFVFTVTEERYKSGFYIPYDINKILYIVGYKNGVLDELIENSDYEYNKSERKIHILNKALLNSNVSMILNVTVRYIITNVIKDTRYQYNENRKAVERLPRLAILKRESVLINNTPLASKSKSDMEEEENQTLSEEGIKLANLENMSSFGLGDL